MAEIQFCTGFPCYKKIGNRKSRSRLEAIAYLRTLGLQVEDTAEGLVINGKTISKFECNAACLNQCHPGPAIKFTVDQKIRTIQATDLESIVNALDS